MENVTEHYWHNKHIGELGASSGVSCGVPSGVSAFLAWLMIWLRVCLVGSRRPFGCLQQAAARPWQPNRNQRRMGRAKIPRTRYYGANYILAGRHLTPRQFTEWQARYSGRGRINVYRMPYWRKTVKGKACPLGTEHEYWRDPPEPLGKRMSKLPCGVWAGHLWPGWWGLYFSHVLLTPESHVGRAISRARVSDVLTFLFYTQKSLSCDRQFEGVKWIRERISDLVGATQPPDTLGI